MKAPLFLFAGFVLSVVSPLCGQDAVRDKDKERKEYWAQLNRVYQAVPAAAKMAKGIDEMMAVLLTVQDTDSASSAARKIKVLDQNSKVLAAPFSKELMAYSQGKSRTDLGLRTLTSTMKKQGNDVLAIVESIQAQGNMTAELADALNLKNTAKSVSGSPSLSAEVADYWKKEFSIANRLNSVLFSLQGKKDIARVSGELKEIRKSRDEIKQIRASLYPLKADSDKGGDAEMSRRLQQGPVRVLNHILSIVSSRGFVDSNDPDMQGISTLIGEAVR